MEVVRRIVCMLLGACCVVHAAPDEVSLEGRHGSGFGRAGWALQAELAMCVVAPHVYVAAASDARGVVFAKAEGSQPASVAQLVGLAAVGPVTDAKLRRGVAACARGV